MSQQELAKEYNELSLIKMKIRNTISQGLNPSGDKQSPGYPVKFIKWQFAIINQELLLRNEHTKAH